MVGRVFAKQVKPGAAMETSMVAQELATAPRVFCFGISGNFIYGNNNRAEAVNMTNKLSTDIENINIREFTDLLSEKKFGMIKQSPSLYESDNISGPDSPRSECESVGMEDSFRFLHKTLSSSEQQHTQPPRPATTRIQQEIDEAVQRERELKEANGIQTSDENIVHKRSQTPDAVNSSTEERESDPNSFSSSNNLSDSLNDGEPSAQAVPTKRYQSSSPSLNNSPFASPTHRFSSGGGQKGLMQRFYASHGRMRIYAAPRNTVPVVVSPPSVSPVHNQPPIQRKIIDINSGNDSQDSDEDLVKTPVRKGYQSAEEKIQAELQEMKKREEELRLLRAKLFAQSQPNLLSIGSIEEEEINHINGDGGKQTLQSAQSIPNLLDSDDSLDVSQDPASQKFQKNSPRKRSALIAEWESRIQKNSEH
ncbi:uncharacterized protein LOC124556269 [Schistocerca americana]|uniref:uncharacterized protein LOC124556269 n=1 Tax=Schistocerca americana TaxID=7009 RepID=UPI001F500B33|nr:uncharacterized protein LOC124556269 [Schistocerca americana]